MFVTFLCAVFEPTSHRLTLANAGHCRPVLLPAGEPPRWAVKSLGTALGFEPGLEFERTELTLKPGDALILYTDGVSEAFNPQDECYGNDRLLADACGLAGQSATAMTASLLRNVRAFAGSAPQSDDIAIMTLKVNAGARINLDLHATPGEVMRGVEALRDFAAAQRVPEEQVFSLALALEECASNVVNHALLRDAQRTFQVAIERTHESFIIELYDDGPEFDPTAAAVLKPQAENSDSSGGWGIELVRRNMDEIRYRREAGKNVLRLTRRLVSAFGSE